MNKITPDISSAIMRIKTYAAPMILLKFNQNFASYVELSQAAEAACCQTVVTGASMTPGRISVILVGESLGY